MIPPLFKVRTSAAFALSCANSKATFGGRLADIAMIVVKGLDFLYDAQEEGEGQHKADLVDQLCLTFCHLLLLAEPSDFHQINTGITEHSPETLITSLNSVMLRISPEKGSTIVKAIAKVKEMSAAVKAVRRTEHPNLDLYCIFSSLKDTLEQAFPGTQYEGGNT